MSVINTLEELNGLDVSGGGILPFSFYNGELYFLYGRENEDIRWSDSGMWADFGGAIDKNESNIDGGIREFWEETNGIFGDIRLIKGYIYKNFDKLLVLYSEKNSNFSIFLPIQYDKKIEKQFINSIKYSKKLLNYDKKKINNAIKNGLLEKDKIKWFSVKEIKKNINKFRICNNDYTKFIIENFN